MPHPTQGETEKDFLHRCIPELIHEGRSQPSSIAICYSIYRREGTEEKSPKPERKSEMNMSESSEYYAYDHPFGHRHPNYKQDHHGDHHHHHGDHHHGDHHHHHGDHHHHHGDHHFGISDLAKYERVESRVNRPGLRYNEKVKYAAKKYL